MWATGDASANICPTDADTGATDTNARPAPPLADANIDPTNDSPDGSCEHCAVGNFPVGLPDLSQGYPCQMDPKYTRQHPGRCGE